MGPREQCAASAGVQRAPGRAEKTATRSQEDAKLKQTKCKYHCRRPAWTALGLCLVLFAVPAGAQNQSETTTPAAAINETSFEPTASSLAVQQQQQHKLRPVNFTLVDELFDKTVNESEMLRHWKSMDGQFQEGIRSILKLVFPQIVAISQDAKVSGDCSGGILKWILSLRNLRSWAIKMLDATGKPTAGIFEGSLTMFGNHRQCLGIRAPDEDEIEITDQFEEYFRGQFCVLHLRPWLANRKPFYHLNSTIEPLLRKNYKYYEKTLYDELAEIAIAFNFIDIRMDLCVPSTCTMADIQRVADLLSKKLEMRAKVMRCDIESRESSTTFVQNLDQTTMIWLAGPAGLILITLISTILVLFRGNKAADCSAKRGAGLSNLLYCLSLQGAARHLLDCPRKSAATRTTTRELANGSSNGPTMAEKPLPLYGLRSVFVIWFIIVQLTVELKYQYLRESLVLRNMMLAYWPLQIIINTSVIFESLILITAFTYGYSTLELTARGLLGYIAAKYVRLMPSIATLVMITIVLPSIGITSPVWRNFVETQSNVCKSTGYLDLLFLQNFIAYDKVCLPHTWLFCVELQLVALSIPLVLLLQRTYKHFENLKIASLTERDLGPVKGRHLTSRESLRRTLHKLITSKAGLLGVLILLAGAAGNFALVYMNQLPPAWFHTFPDGEQKKYYFSIYLMKASTHLTTFIVGLYAGHLTRTHIRLAQGGDASTNSSSVDGESGQTRNKSRPNRFQTMRGAGLQLAAFVCLASTVFLTYSWSTQQLPSPSVAALYDSASRLVWSVALAGLMVQLCRPNSSGEYSKLARLFSLPICVRLGRLSFLAYLTAPLVHTFILAVQEQSLFPSLYLIFHVMLGNIVITYLLAFVLSLMIEQPIRLVFQQLSRAASKQSSGCVSISDANATTTTSATSLAS